MKVVGIFAALAVSTASLAQADVVYRFYSVTSELPPAIQAGNWPAAPDSAPLLLPSSPSFDCTGDGDYCGASLGYTLSPTRSLVVTASSGQVIQDFAPTDGGLGANDPSSNGDNINAGESVTLTFDQSTTLSGIYAWSNHYYGDPSGTFMVNSQSFSFGAPGSWVDVNLTGTTFTFSHSGTDIYVSALRIVPEPATLAIMGLGLMGAGFARRTKRA
jgi:hypothetical protein